MLVKRLLSISILALISLGCTKNLQNDVVILFEKPLMLKQEQELVLNLLNSSSKKKLSEILKDQSWIESYLIKKYAFQPTQLFINSKEPKYVWKNSFYLDAQLSKFPYLGDVNNLLHLNIPIEFVSSWMQIENELFSIIDTYELKISSVSFTEAEGWYFQTSNNLRINLGSDISANALKKLSNALKYIFEKNLTPSIIDLRYKNGAALNYGK